MAISSSSMRVQTGTGNGAIGQTFSGTFKIFATSDLQVYVETSVADVFELKTLGVDYSVVFDTDAATYTITTLVAFTSGRDVNIFSAVPQTQGTSLPREGPTPAKTLEKMMDRLNILVLDLQEKVNRAFLQKKTPAQPTAIELPLPATRANKYLSFDANGVPTASSTITGGTSATAFVQTILDDADAPSVLATIRAGLVDLTAGDTADELFIYDASSTTMKKITVADLLEAINTLTQDSSPDQVNDFLVSYDASAGAAKKVALKDAFKLPTQQRFTSGSGTYTTPTGARQLRIRMVGGGGGGGAAVTNAGAAGGNTTFSTLTANGGSGGSPGTGASSTSVAGSTGGSASGGNINLPGGGSGASPGGDGSTASCGGIGGNSAFGGAGQGGANSAGGAAGANTGSGGGGGATPAASGAGGGGAGGYVEHFINSPAATYSYAVGAGGAGGAAGTYAGGNGAAGIIIVDEIY